MSNVILGRTPEQSEIVQAYGTLGPSRLGLEEAVRLKSVGALNRLVAHTMALRDLYKKAHWQTSGATFYGLHLLFDKHHGEQLEITDALAERVQTLGGVTLAPGARCDRGITHCARTARARERDESIAPPARRT
jgi:starvation-inducible DNA-binding protein